MQNCFAALYEEDRANKIRGFLQRGADPNLCTIEGELPLYQTLIDGNKEIAALLIDFNADTLLTDAHGNNGFFFLWSSPNDNAQTVMELCDKMLKATISSAPEIFKKKNRQGQTALHHMIQWHPDATFLDHLAKKGVDLNVKGSEGRTPLFECVRLSAQKSAEGLLAAGANIDAIDSNGNTPLAFAFGQSELEMAKLLFNQGAALTTQALNNAYECWQLDQKLASDLYEYGDFSNATISKDEFGKKFHL
jgi:ankyrin repeat protein